MYNIVIIPYRNAISQGPNIGTCVFSAVPGILSNWLYKISPVNTITDRFRKQAQIPLNRKHIAS
jgi:hypothetical protein